MDAETFSFRGSLEKIYLTLPEDQFIRCHRSYIISLARAERLNIGREFVMVGPDKVPIGGKYKKSVIQAFKSR